MLQAWGQTTTAHSVAFHSLEDSRDEMDIISAIDHVPACFDKTVDVCSLRETEPDRELVNIIRRNARFIPGCGPLTAAGHGVIEDECYDNVSTAVDVMVDVPEAREARAQDLDRVKLALIACFPRLAESALRKLTFGPPERRCYAGETWPVYVNPTRACYQLYKTLAIPVLPNPVYLVELLARGWRRVPRETLERFTPMSAGPIHAIDGPHFERYFLGPLRLLEQLGVMSEREKRSMVHVLHDGLLPCFAGQGDSSPDRLVSSTLALTFSACGIRAFRGEDRAQNGVAVTVTTAGLLYFAAWYLLVYTCAVHAFPTLKTRLLATGSDADKCLCAAFSVSEIDYSVTEYEGKRVADALRTVFRDTLDGHTALRLVQLYVPTMWAQLPYVGKLGLIPGSVKSALEIRDVWLAKERGSVAIAGDRDRTPFAYLGHIAQGFHSSLNGTLTRGDLRPRAQTFEAPPQVQFDLWCNSIVAHDDENRTRGLEDALRDKIVYPDDTGECFMKLQVPRDDAADADETQKRETERAQPADARPADPGEVIEAFESLTLNSPVHRTNTNTEVDCRVSGKAEHTPENIQRAICKGLVLNTVDNLGFNVTGDAFLALSMKRNVHTMIFRRGEYTINNPCMTNIGATVYSKVEQNGHPDTTGHTPHPRLIEALWVLFTVKNESSVYREPKTPEALAVMVHLTVKAFGCEPAALAACKDITRICAACAEENDFIPISAIVTGMFGVNLEVITGRYKYYIRNDLHDNQWAPGSLVCVNSQWYVTSEDVGSPVAVPKEPRHGTSRHSGVISAYCRLNDLRVQAVPSDNYCGFHTAAVLLSYSRDSCDRDTKKKLVDRTVQYMMSNKDSHSGIRVYLVDMSIENDTQLTKLFMTEKRWLTVDEMRFIFLAHGKTSHAITDYSFPIYNKDHVYFLIKYNHFEPVLSSVNLDT